MESFMGPFLYTVKASSEACCKERQRNVEYYPFTESTLRRPAIPRFAEYIDALQYIQWFLMLMMILLCFLSYVTSLSIPTDSDL